MTMDNAALSYQRMGQLYKGNKKSEQLDKSVVNLNKNEAHEKKDNPYLVNAVMTASKEKLTLMLYDGAIRFMTQTIAYTEAKNMVNANNCNIRAQDIFSELLITLNMDYQLSQNLYSLYSFIKESLIKANIKKDTELIKEMISLTRELRDTWSEAMKIANKA